MAKFPVGAIVQMKTGGINGVIESQIEPDSDNPKAWVKWDDGTYSVHAEREFRSSTTDSPKLYKKLA